MTKDFNMDENKLIKILIVITSILILVNIINDLLGQPSWQITSLIYVGFEANITTWFSSILLLIAAIYAYKCFLASRRNQSEQKIWQFLSLGLLGMSCDEVATIHERLGNTLNKYYFQFDAIKKSSWVIILGPAILLILLLFALKMRKYLKNSAKAKRLLITGILAYVGGAFILEATINLLNHDTLEWLWKIEIILEESFEMFGVILIIMGLMEHHKFINKESSCSKIGYQGD